MFINCQDSKKEKKEDEIKQQEAMKRDINEEDIDEERIQWRKIQDEKEKIKYEQNKIQYEQDPKFQVYKDIIFSDYLDQLTEEEKIQIIMDYQMAYLADTKGIGCRFIMPPIRKFFEKFPDRKYLCVVFLEDIRISWQVEKKASDEKIKKFKEKYFEKLKKEYFEEFKSSYVNYLYRKLSEKEIEEKFEKEFEEEIEDLVHSLERIASKEYIEYKQTPEFKEEFIKRITFDIHYIESVFNENSDFLKQIKLQYEQDPKFKVYEDIIFSDYLDQLTEEEKIQIIMDYEIAFLNNKKSILPRFIMPPIRKFFQKFPDRKYLCVVFLEDVRISSKIEKKASDEKIKKFKEKYFEKLKKEYFKEFKASYLYSLYSCPSLEYKKPSEKEIEEKFEETMENLVHSLEGIASEKYKKYKQTPEFKEKFMKRIVFDIHYIESVFDDKK